MSTKSKGFIRKKTVITLCLIHTKQYCRYVNEKADNLLIMRTDSPNDSSSRTRWDLDGRTLPSVKGKGTKYIRAHPS